MLTEEMASQRESEQEPGKESGKEPCGEYKLPSTIRVKTGSKGLERLATFHIDSFCT